MILSAAPLRVIIRCADQYKQIALRRGDSLEGRLPALISCPGPPHRHQLRLPCAVQSGLDANTLSNRKARRAFRFQRVSCIDVLPARRLPPTPIQLAARSVPRPNTVCNSIKRAKTIKNHPQLETTNTDPQFLQNLKEAKQLFPDGFDCY